MDPKESRFSIKSFVKGASFGGMLLIFVTIIGLVWANSKFYDSYHHLWHNVEFGLSLGSWELKSSLHHWINDGLMALFFFTIGLEIKREVLAGELSSVKKATMPIVAAIGGMLVPALIYAAINFNNPQNITGWGIPMATDIAFALGIMSLLGNKVPLNLKVFLTALAIADDLGAIMIIAIFYTDAINVAELINAAIFFGVLVIANWIGIRKTAFYAIVGLLGVWMSFVFSGVHATVAGVLIAFTIPVKAKVSEQSYIEMASSYIEKFSKKQSNDSPLLTNEQSHIVSEMNKLTEEAQPPLQKLEHALHPFAIYFILPLFALANAGVHIEGNLMDLVMHPVSIGIVAGLVLGKFLGIAIFSKLVVALKWSELPEGVSWGHIYGVGFLAGIGFTMSIFISDLAFESEELAKVAKVGIFIASFLAAVIGYFFLKYSKSK